MNELPCRGQRPLVPPSIHQIMGKMFCMFASEPTATSMSMFASPGYNRVHREWMFCRPTMLSRNNGFHYAVNLESDWRAVMSSTWLPCQSDNDGQRGSVPIQVTPNDCGCRRARPACRHSASPSPPTPPTSPPPPLARGSTKQHISRAALPGGQQDSRTVKPHVGGHQKPLEPLSRLG